jgi:hypothetical protein
MHRYIKQTWRETGDGGFDLFFFFCFFLFMVVAGGTQKWLDGGLGRDEIEEIERSI